MSFFVGVMAGDLQGEFEPFLDAGAHRIWGAGQRSRSPPQDSSIDSIKTGALPQLTRAATVHCSNLW